MKVDYTKDKFMKLLEIVKKLRAPGGCPWDREQTDKSLRPYIIEEVYELIDAIDNEDYHAICEELGDILLHVLFHADIREESGDFSLDDVIDKISEKLIRRHPHVFADVIVSGTDEVLHNWENIKLQERERYDVKASLLDGIPESMSALLIAQRMQEKASRIGFDWDNIGDVFGKVREEFSELEAMIDRDHADGMEDELGDLLFALTNLARFLGMNAEMALRRTNSKFARRFKYIEKQIREKDITNPTLEEMDVFWDEIKAIENSSKKVE